MKKVLKGLLALLLAVVVVIIGYVSYVFISYHRIEDNLLLTVDNIALDTIDGNKTFSILSWNVGFGAYSADYSFFLDGGTESRAFSKDAVIENISSMAKVIKSYDADFNLIQEVDYDSTRSYGVDERQLFYSTLSSYSRVFATNYDSPYLFYPLTCPHGKNKSGIITLSKYAITQSIRRSLPVATGVSKITDLDRCFTVSKLELNGGKLLYIYNVHLTAYTDDATIAVNQLKVLTDDMYEKYKTGAYIVCGGDFNKDLLGDSSQYFGVSGENAEWAKPIPEGSIPDWLTVVAGSNAPSCRNADRPYGPDDFVVTIDGFLVSDNIEVKSIEVIDEQFAHSDHNPTLMTFTLKDYNG